MESEVFTAGGDAEEVTVTVTSPSGSPQSGSVLAVESVTGPFVAMGWKDGRNTTDANGQAVLLAQATDAGTGAITVVDAAGNRGAAPQQAGRYTLTLLPELRVCSAGRQKGVTSDFQKWASKRGHS